MTYTLLPAGIGKQMPHKFQRLPERVSGLVEVTETEGYIHNCPRYIKRPGFMEPYVNEAVQIVEIHLAGSMHARA